MTLCQRPWKFLMFAMGPISNILEVTEMACLPWSLATFLLFWLYYFSIKQLQSLFHHPMTSGHVWFEKLNTNNKPKISVNTPSLFCNSSLTIHISWLFVVFVWTNDSFVLDGCLILNTKYITFVCAHLVPFGVNCTTSGIPK